MEKIAFRKIEIDDVCCFVVSWFRGFVMCLCEFPFFSFIKFSVSCC